MSNLVYQSFMEEFKNFKGLDFIQRTCLHVLCFDGFSFTFKKHKWKRVTISVIVLLFAEFQVIENKAGLRPTIRGTVKQLVSEDGWRGFYRGLGPRFLSMSLWGTSMIVTYEFLSMCHFLYANVFFIFLLVYKQKYEF